MNESSSIYIVQTAVPGPRDKLPLVPDVLTHAPSADLFGWIQDGADACMMWMRFLIS
jgi:hypothetical protein